MTRRWEAAVAAGEARVVNLARTVRGFKAALERNEIGASAYFRKVADKIDHETEQLNLLFTTNAPPLDGFMEERLTYRQGQDRLRARITELCKIL